jgi:SAM-dependent methyltransferase
LSINPTASSGFERAASEYERARPSYPAEVLGLLPSDGLIVDVAAGTGKLTRLLPGHVVAVEPVAAMRAIAATFAPTVAGTAELLPLRDACADAVTVAQAFHWFDIQRALAEVRRVLRPGGTLLLVWNERDERVPWVNEMGGIIHAHDPNAYLHDLDWPTLVADSGLFTPVVSTVVDNPQRGATKAMVVERALSTSYIASGTPELRQQVLREVSAVIAGFEEPFDFPYVTHLFTCTRC